MGSDLMCVKEFVVVELLEKFVAFAKVEVFVDF